MESVEILRDFYQSIQEFRENLTQQRNFLDNNIDNLETYDLDWVISIISTLYHQVKGINNYNQFSNILLNYFQNNEDDKLCNKICEIIIEIISVFDLNKEIIIPLFQYYRNNNKLSLSYSLINTFESCLFETIISCFDTPDILVDQSGIFLNELNNNYLRINENEENKTQNSNLLLNDEMTNILQQLANLRKDDISKNNIQSKSENDNSFSEYNINNKYFENSQDISQTNENNNDWITYFDEGTGKYYMYSESTGESKWIE